LHSFRDKPNDAAAIVREQVHPVLDGPPERRQGRLDRQQQHLHKEGDEDGPPPPPLGDLGADGAVHGVVVGDLAGAQQVQQAPDAALVRPQHHEVAEEVVPGVHGCWLVVDASNRSFWIEQTDRSTTRYSLCLGRQGEYYIGMLPCHL